MGLRDVLRFNRYEAAIQAASYAPDPSTFPIASPWAESHLERIVYRDIFGEDVPLNTREAAMRVPAVARARQHIIGSVSPYPLVAMRRDQRVDPTPTWLYRSGPGDPTPPQLRMAFTLDDLIFHGMSCWWRDNGADGFPLAARRINWGEWRLNADNRVEVHGQAVADENVIVFVGFHEGILRYGIDALDDIRAIYRNVRNRLSTPNAGVDLHQTGGRDLTDPEIDKLIDRWVLARSGKTGGVAFTSKDIEAKPIPYDGGEVMIEARNAAAVDVARMIGVSAGLVDATTPKASLNYETKEGRNEELVDRDLAIYTTPVVARLSEDDCSPMGTRVAFDFEAFTKNPSSPTGPVLED